MPNRVGPYQGQAALALQVSEERYRLLFERSLAGHYRSAASTGRLLDCNEAFAAIFGYGTREHCLAQHVMGDPAHPEAREVLVARLRQEGRVRDVEMCLPRA